MVVPHSRPSQRGTPWYTQSPMARARLIQRKSAASNYGIRVVISTVMLLFFVLVAAWNFEINVRNPMRLAGVKALANSHLNNEEIIDSNAEVHMKALAEELQKEKYIEDSVNAEKKSEYQLTIVTGTHTPDGVSNFVHSGWANPGAQSETCDKISEALHLMWTAWEVETYTIAKHQLVSLLEQLRTDKTIRCVLGSRKFSVNDPERLLWTFPISVHRASTCSTKTANMLQRKTWLKEKTKVMVPWFLLRPDLVTLEQLALKVGIKLKVVAFVGDDFRNAAFSLEGCERFNSILKKRDIYKYRLLLVSQSDLKYQIEKLTPNTRVIVRKCGTDRSYFSDSELNNIFTIRGNEKDFYTCSNRDGIQQQFPQSLFISSSITTSAFQKQIEIPKTKVSGSPTLVFVAGLEGVGHHLFAKLGRKHTVRFLYDSLTNYLCDSAWNDDSITTHSSARAELVEAFRKLHDTPAFEDGSRVFFLNTVFVEKAVNMYSYPWGGPRCYLKRFARAVCNIDTIDLARIAEEAGIDFRIVVLRRSIGAAVVSAALHRPFGILVSETRMLIQSWALLRTHLNILDERFYLEITYEDLLSEPESSANRLIEHMNIPKDSALHQWFIKYLTISSRTHPLSDPGKWKNEVSNDELNFMTDLLYLK